MATPNIANVATVKPVMKAGVLSASAADLCDVPAESCMKIDSIYVANVHGTNSPTIEFTVSTVQYSTTLSPGTVLYPILYLIDYSTVIERVLGFSSSEGL